MINPTEQQLKLAQHTFRDFCEAEEGWDNSTFQGAFDIVCIRYGDVAVSDILSELIIESIALGIQVAERA